MVKEKFIKLNNKDNVGTALQKLNCGDQIYFSNEESVILLDDIPAGFKFAIKKINKGELVLKYAEVIGIAKTNILPGELVHINNIEGLRGRGDKEISLKKADE